MPENAREAFKSLYSRQVCKIANHVNEDVNALEEDGLVDELVVIVEEDGGAVEGGEPNGRNTNLMVISGGNAQMSNLWRWF